MSSFSRFHGLFLSLIYFVLIFTGSMGLGASSCWDIDPTNIMSVFVVSHLYKQSQTQAY